MDLKSWRKLLTLFRSKIVIVGILGLLSKSALAAPCCGGASALPSLITGDDQAQMSFASSAGGVVSDVSPQGVPTVRVAGDSETIQTMTLGGAYRVLDRFQMGAEIPLISRERSTSAISAQAAGLGDVRLDTAYEFLPEWSYSTWRPHGLVFFQMNLPTGPSIYDASSPYLLDARGRGFFSTALGLVFVKGIGNFDFLLSGEIHRSFPRTMDNGDGTTTELIPSYGASGVAGVGYTPGSGSWRIGVNLSPVFEGPIEAQGEINSVSDNQLVWNTCLALGYSISSDLSAVLVYTDQTLLGPSQNVSLSRTVAVNLQKRWEL